MAERVTSVLCVTEEKASKPVRGLGKKNPFSCLYPSGSMRFSWFQCRVGFAAAFPWGEGQEVSPKRL